MRNAETVLTIIRERGKQGLPLEDVRHECHRWTPVRRVYIPKKKGGQRPLGLPTWKDKLLQEVMRSILEAYYEPQMSQHSHGFRPGRGCHTALREIQATWTGSRWLVEGDIAKFFDTMDHEVLLAILSENIHDQRFLRLVRHLLESGYLEEWRFNTTLSGCPQGGVISPILSNIYLDKLDQYVEHVLIPMARPIDDSTMFAMRMIRFLALPVLDLKRRKLNNNWDTSCTRPSNWKCLR